MQRKWLVHIQQWQLSLKTHLHLSNLSLQIPTIDKNVNMTDIETSAEFSDHYTSAEDDF